MLRPKCMRTPVSLVAVAVVLLVAGAACTSEASGTGSGRALPFRVAATTTGSESAPDALVVDRPTKGYQPTVTEQRARELAATPPSTPGEPSKVEAFRLGRVTLTSGYALSAGTDGAFDGAETWVELHLVPAGEHPASAGGRCTPKDAYRWAVLVNAKTGAVATWTQGFASGRC
jgi:hypothetical protein